MSTSVAQLAEPSAPNRDDAGSTPAGRVQYHCVLADPPWPEYGGGRRGAQNHYPLLSVPDVARTILRSPRWLDVSLDAHLWMWAPSRLWMALAVIDALGFQQVTYMPWYKGRIGLGRYLRHDTEICLFAVRGRRSLPESAPAQALIEEASEPIVATPTRHSEKPVEQYHRIEKVSPGPYLELFARRHRTGWDAWGNEL